MALIDELLDDARERMHKSVEAIAHELATVRAGRANPALLDRIEVDYYGTATPLRNLATISAPEARLLTIAPFDVSSIKAVEKAINESDLGLHPSNDGRVVRLVVPELNEERRHELVRVARHIVEEGRVAVRNVRRDVMHDVKEQLKKKLVSQDDERRAETEVQKLTDKHIADIEAALAAKEKEVMQV